MGFLGLGVNVLEGDSGCRAEEAVRVGGVLVVQLFNVFLRLHQPVTGRVSQWVVSEPPLHRPIVAVCVGNDSEHGRGWLELGGEVGQRDSLSSGISNAEVILRTAGNEGVVAFEHIVAVVAIVESIM